MTTLYDIGFEEALAITLKRLSTHKTIDIRVDEACGFVVAEDCRAVVDCPSTTTSMKDGYAVVSADVKDASKENPVKLKLLGMMSAGDERHYIIGPGKTVKVMTGASIPQNADAVVAIEFTSDAGDQGLFFRDAPVGKNILSRGSDVAKDELLAAKGDLLSPAMTGLLAAGGIHSIRVYTQPRVGILATGDEVVAPGKPLKPGQLYASNMVTLLSWLQYFRMETEAAVVPDEKDTIRNTMGELLKKVDVLLTSGGAWKSERDLTTGVLIEMGGDVVFHRVRLGPGKAAALILLDEKVVFCLPGGPPSNEMAFLQIALPGLLKMAGKSPVPFEARTAVLSSPVRGDIAWTQFYQARLEKKEGQLYAHPLKLKSRLQSQATADALIKVPEGVRQLNKGDEIEVQVLGLKIGD